VYRRILGPVYGDEKENWRILTNKGKNTPVTGLTSLEGG
jgi:hypothetical protein